jgi:hypothetical protein
MSALGGFAAVAYVSQADLDTCIDMSWGALWHSAILPGAASIPSPLGSIGFDGIVMIEKPSVFLRSKPANFVNTRVTVYARFTCRLGTRRNTLLLKTDCTLDVPLSVAQGSFYDDAVVDFTGFTIAKDQIEILWTDAPALELGWFTALRDAATSPQMLNWIAAQVRSFLGNRLRIPLPTSQIATRLFSISFQNSTGMFIILPNCKLAGARALDGWLAVGIDDLSSGIAPATSGNLDLLDGPGPLEFSAKPRTPDRTFTVLGCVDSPRMKTYLAANVRLALDRLVAEHSNVHVDTKSLPNVQMRPNNTYYLELLGSVDSPDPFPGVLPMSVQLSVTLAIYGLSLVYRGSAHADVDKPWYIDAIVDVGKIFGKDFEKKLNDINNAPPTAGSLNVSGNFDLPYINGLHGFGGLFNLAVSESTIHLYAQVTLYPDASLPPRPADDLTGEISPGLFPIRKRFLSLIFQSDKLRFDPTYLVRFAVTRGSDKSTIISGVTWSGSGGDLAIPTLDTWEPSVVLEDDYETRVTVERPPGDALSTTTRGTGIMDKFDRRHPYARWKHDHYYYRFFVGSPKKQQGYKLRISVVHKTDIRTRCQFCDAGKGSLYFIEALDNLPAPSKKDFRVTLCPYCFTFAERSALRDTVLAEKPSRVGLEKKSTTPESGRKDRSKR